MPEPTPLVPTAPQSVPSQLLHDLRTPVHQIVGYVEMLQEDAVQDGHQALAGDLGKVKTAAAQLQKMLEERFVAARATDATPATSHAPNRGGPGAAAVTAPINAPIAVATPVAAPAAASAEGDDTALSSGAERGLLLVVDDNETNREVLSRRLKMQGYATQCEPDGAAALSAIANRVFDLVLLDIMMPDMDGYEVLRRLKADEQTRDVPVIMISAIGDLDSVVRCIELGAEDYLPKPFNPTLLKARIGACLEKKRGRDREARLFAELQENYGRLQELEKMRDDLTNMIVHDLRTPLSSIMAGLQTIPMLGSLDEPQQECCDIALRSSTALLNMINDLLDISKLEGGTPDLDIREVDVAALIESALEQVSSAAAQRNIEWQREVTPDLPAFKGDEDKLRRTLVNLLGNAIKFSPTGGRIVVGARTQISEAPEGEAPEGEAPMEAQISELNLWVRDHGEGIPRDAFERIFEKFGQVADRKAGRAMSTGLGLALCKMVVDAHGGRVEVESELGQGSTFTVALPLH